jgi:3-deoxy-manno-octulosonate cytidylyltransferase (CMP-KDO synthetase)
VLIACFAGTERCSEALQKLRKKFDIVVNIQGDEPLMEPEIIDGVVKTLQVFSLYVLLDEMTIHI